MKWSTDRYLVVASKYEPTHSEHEEQYTTVTMSKEDQTAVHNN